VASAFIIATIAEGLLFSFGVFFEPLLSEFGWTRVVTSGAISLAGIVLPLVGIVSGRLTDRFGPRPILVASGISFGMTYMLMSQISQFWHFYILYGVFAVGLGLYWLPLISTIPRWFISKRSLMMAIFTSGIGTGQLICPPMTTWLILENDWRSAYLSIGAISMVLIIAAAMLLRRNPEPMNLKPYGHVFSEPDELPKNPASFTVAQAWRTRQFWLSSISFSAFVYCWATVLSHIVIYGIGIGMSPSIAAWILAVVGIVGIPGRLVFGQLADSFGLKSMLLISFVLQAAAFSLLTITSDVSSTFVFATIFGLSYGTVELLISPVLVELFGLRFLGNTAGLSQAFSSPGLLLGPVIAGYIFDVTGKYDMAFLICTVMCVVGFICSFLLPLGKEKRSAGR